MAKTKGAPAQAEGVTIVELRAKNILRLSAIAIRPGGPGLVQITGRNDQGKSSVLRAIKAAMDGRRGLPFGALRDGAEQGYIFADLGKLQVRRVIRKTKDGEDWDLSVAVDGKAVGKRPQDVLTAFLGALSFDPLAASRLKPREQADLLKRLAPDFDFEANEQARAKAFAERTEVGRDRDRARGAADRARAALPPGPRPEPVDASAVAAELTQALERNSALEGRLARRKAAEEQIEAKLDQAERLRAQAASLEKEAEGLQGKLDAAAKENPVSVPVDVAPLKAKLDMAAEVNAAAAAHDRCFQHEDEADDHAEAYNDLTAKIAALDKAKAEAVASADLPVEGLSLAEDGVLFDGRPLSEAGKAVQIRTWCAVAMALNPQLRVVLIDEGSELDAESRDLVHSMAVEKGYEVWIARVCEEEGVGFMIEDGTNK